jgi:hypothetical protein
MIFFALMGARGRLAGRKLLAQQREPTHWPNNQQKMPMP